MSATQRGDSELEEFRQNARDILACYRELGDKLGARFNAKATKDNHLWYYREPVRRFEARPEVPRH